MPEQLAPDLVLVRNKDRRVPGCWDVQVLAEGMFWELLGERNPGECPDARMGESMANCSAATIRL